MYSGYDDEFRNEANFQLLIMTIVTSITTIFLSTQKSKSYKNKFLQMFDLIRFSTFMATICCISFFAIKINGTDISVDNLPYWFNPWWVVSEILFVINLMIFSTNYLIEYLPVDFDEMKYTIKETEIEFHPPSKRGTIIKMIFLVSTLSIILGFSLLMFFLSIK